MDGVLSLYASNFSVDALRCYCIKLYVRFRHCDMRVFCALIIPLLVLLFIFSSRARGTQSYTVMAPSVVCGDHEYSELSRLGIVILILLTFGVPIGLVLGRRYIKDQKVKILYNTLSGMLWFSSVAAFLCRQPFQGGTMRTCFGGRSFGFY